MLKGMPGGLKNVGEVVFEGGVAAVNTILTSPQGAVVGAMQAK